MFKFTDHISYFMVFAVTCIVFPCSSFTCVHDEIEKANPVQTTFPRSTKKYYEIIEERVKDSVLFEPLEIFFYLDNIEQALTTNAFYNIKIAMLKIEKYISSKFEVRKRNKPFLLERQSCDQKWQYGNNRGKCSKYSGDQELCFIPEDYFEIPDKFLDKLEVFDDESTYPHYVVDAGLGLNRGNFITFVTSITSSFCQGRSDVMAYGMNCRVHPITNEPLAGILNLCPDYFSSKIYPAQHYYNILLHEMFHLLGFSVNAFEKFLPCQKGIPCNLPKSAVQNSSDGIFRMMFPDVIKYTQSHFNCSVPDFGGPMESQTSSNNDTFSEFSSHWHPVIMHSSIMTSSFSERDHLYVDDITLSLFASSGWYRVKFGSKEPFPFGKDKGCDFGITGICDNVDFCDLTNFTTRCDMVHKSIGRCIKIDDSYPCGAYEPYSVVDCNVETNYALGLNSYALGYELKCLHSEMRGETVKPVCLPVKCESKETYNVLVNMTWLPCPNSENITKGNFTVFCENGNMFCAEFKEYKVTDRCSKDQFFFIHIRLYFRVPKLSDLLVDYSFKNFKVNTVRAIAEKMSIPANFITNSAINVFKQIYLDLSICPPVSNETLLREILDNIQAFMDGGHFMQVLKGQTDLVIASSDITMDPSDIVAFSDHEGFRALLVFPIICAIFLIVTVSASLIRLLIVYIDRPRRAAIASEEAMELEQVPEAT